VDDIRVGRILRALRRRAGLTQRELGKRSGLSQQAVSLIERGHGSQLSGATSRRLFAALDARWEPTVSWRGGDLDRVLDEAHSRLVDEVVRRLIALRWDVRVEVTYSEFGERGSIDVLAARRDLLAVVNIEVKSDLTVIEATVRKTDEKDRLVRRSLARERFGFTPRSVGRLLVLPASTAARRRVRLAGATLTTAFPRRGAEVRDWLRHPSSDLAGILFVPDTNRGGGKRNPGGFKRVRTPRSRSHGT
jgi:transcriptional regulator with XRE-family HTH domain